MYFRDGQSFKVGTILRGRPSTYEANCYVLNINIMSFFGWGAGRHDGCRGGKVKVALALEARSRLILALNGCLRRPITAKTHVGPCRAPKARGRGEGRSASEGGGVGRWSEPK